MSDFTIAARSSELHELTTTELASVSGGTLPVNHTLGDHVEASASQGSTLGGKVGGDIGSAIGGAIGAVVGFVEHLLE